MTLKTDINYKKLIGKRFTTPERTIYQEKSEKTIHVNSSDIWNSTISSNPNDAINDNTTIFYNKQILTPDLVYPNNVFYFMIDSGSFVAGINDYESGISNNALRKDFINERYGSSYEVKLYSFDNIQIGKTNPIEWEFDYTTGILYINNPLSYQLPYKLSAYLYTGKILNFDIVERFNIIDKEMLALLTVNDNDLACNTGISELPLDDSGVRVYINSVRVSSGNGLTDYCYFSNDNGVTKKEFGNEELGDKLYWIGSVAEYELDTTDLVTFDYLIK